MSLSKDMASLIIKDIDSNLDPSAKCDHRVYMLGVYI